MHYMTVVSLEKSDEPYLVAKTVRNGRKNHDFALEKQRVSHVIALILAS